MIQKVIAGFWALSLLATQVWAFSEDAWILSAGTSAGFNLQTGSPQTLVIDGRAGIGYGFTSWGELLVLGSYASLKTDGLAEFVQSEFDLQFNLVIAGSHASAFYIGPRAGLRSLNQYGDKSSMTVYGGALGKRFPLSGVVSFSPEATLTFVKSSEGYSTPAIGFVPLQFSLVF